MGIALDLGESGVVIDRYIYAFSIITKAVLNTVPPNEAVAERAKRLADA
jgi:hypothetical protein